MIAKIKFDGIVKNDKKKTTMSDQVQIHALTLDEAKSIFMSWISKNAGIRGDSGVFHPLVPYGEIKVRKIEEGK